MKKLIILLLGSGLLAGFQKKTSTPSDVMQAVTFGVQQIDVNALKSDCNVVLNCSGIIPDIIRIKIVKQKGLSKQLPSY